MKKLVTEMEKEDPIQYLKSLILAFPNSKTLKKGTSILKIPIKTLSNHITNMPHIKLVFKSKKIAKIHNMYQQV
jgi:hypothetical protein